VCFTGVVLHNLQVLDDISRGVIKVGDKLSELRFLKDTGRKMEVSVTVTLAWCPRGSALAKKLEDTDELNSEHLEIISFASPLILFSSLFHHLSPPLLIFSFDNRPALFPGRMS